MGKLTKHASHLLLLFAIFVTSLRLFPEYLGWPHHKKIDEFDVYSEYPIEDNIESIIKSSKYRAISRSKLGYLIPSRNIFITNGGWRWHMISLNASNAFAISNPLTEKIFLNKSNIKLNTVYNNESIGNKRPLDRVIAHEMAHGLVREHFGKYASAIKPAWLVEEFCDYVADNSSLSESEFKSLRAKHVDHPGLLYYEGRLRVQQMLDVDRLSVDQIFSKY